MSVKKLTILSVSRKLMMLSVRDTILSVSHLGTLVGYASETPSIDATPL